MRRGEIWWADLPEPRGSEPAYRRPVLIIQSNIHNKSSLQTVIIAALTTNLRLAAFPGNVTIGRKQSGLPRECVINNTQLMALDRRYLLEKVGTLPAPAMNKVDDGLRLVLSL